MNKQETEQVSLETLKAYIAERKIARMKSLFDGEQQIRQIEYLFYYFNKRHYREANEPEILFETRDYIVVRGLRGYSEYNGYYHAVWVIGIDNNIPWIHRLQWVSLFEESKPKITEDMIREWMHFDKSVQPEQKFNVGERVRIQGDLVIQKTDSIEGFAAIHNSELQDIAIAFRDEFDKKAKEEFKDEIDEENIKKDSDAVYKIRNKRVSKRTKEDYQFMDDIRKKYDLDDYHSIVNQLDEVLHMREWKAITDAQKKYHYDGMLQKHLLPHIKRLMPDYIKDESKFVKQINKRLGNHLIIIERAQQNHDESARGIRVFKDTICHVIHDQHENKTVKLDPGIYDIELLTRHVTDRPVGGDTW